MNNNVEKIDFQVGDILKGVGGYYWEIKSVTDPCIEIERQKAIGENPFVCSEFKGCIEEEIQKGYLIHYKKVDHVKEEK